MSNKIEIVTDKINTKKMSWQDMILYTVIFIFGVLIIVSMIKNIF